MNLKVFSVVTGAVVAMFGNLVVADVSSGNGSVILDEATTCRNTKAGTPSITEGQVRALFDLWNDALATGDSHQVAMRYTRDAVLLPTVSDVPRTDYASIKDYFDLFLKKKPQGVILEGHIKIGKNWAEDNGIYAFTMGIDGSTVKARYSFTYTMEDGVWKISHHHSSIMPEGIALTQAISDIEIRNLFQLWNDALATGDSSVVAGLYSARAVLLPTVSDIPRTSYDAIKAYFDHFLTKKPQGKIIESHVVKGANWAQDAGIYEFTMGIDGSVVRGRYSFVYVYENNSWKILHHHSSVMPEGLVVPKSEPIDIAELDVSNTLDATVQVRATNIVS